MTSNRGSEQDIRGYMHEGYVQTIQTGGFFASCPSCGSSIFPDRATCEEAQADVDAHFMARERIWQAHLAEIGAVR